MVVFHNTICITNYTTAETPSEIEDHLIHSDPEIKELHEELHHLEADEFEEKKRIDQRIKNRM